MPASNHVSLSVDFSPAIAAASNWHPITYRLRYGQRRARRRLGDLIWASSGNFACKSWLVERLRSALEAHCEFLPIAIEGSEAETYFLVHTIRIIDAVPKPARFDAMELIKGLNAPDFQRSAFSANALFREPRAPSAVSCIGGFEPTETDFAALFHELALTGLELRKVWQAAV